MGTAGPVAEVAVRDELELSRGVGDGGLRGGHNVGIIITTQAALGDKCAKGRQSVNVGKGLVVVITRKRKVETRLAAGTAGRKLDAVVHEGHSTGARRCMVGRVGTHDDNIALDSRTPGGLGVAQKLDLVEAAAVGVGHDNGLVLGKVGRCHGIPLGLRGDFDCTVSGQSMKSQKERVTPYPNS